MPTNDIEKLPKDIQRIREQAVPTDPQSLWSNDAVVAASVRGADFEERHYQGLDWTDTIVTASRFTATTFERASFDGVVLLDCELSGVTFVDCFFRNSLAVGCKSTNFLVFGDSTITGLTLSNTMIDNLEFRRSKVGQLTIAGTQLVELFFHACSPHRRHAIVRLSELKLGAIGGVQELRTAGIEVRIDSDLWRLMGNLYLRQLGLGEMDAAEKTDLTRLLSSASESITP